MADALRQSMEAAWIDWAGTFLTEGKPDEAALALAQAEYALAETDAIRAGQR